jgi:hypothetical protein
MLVRFFCMYKLVSLRFFLGLYLLLIVVSCGTDARKDTEPDLTRNDQVLRRPLDVSGSYVINPVTGDSIEPVLDRNGAPFKTMNPVTAKGRIDEFYQQPTKVVPATWEKLDKKLSSKIQRIEVDIIQKPLVFDTLPVVMDDAFVLKSAIGDTILTGVPVKLEGKKTPAKYPQPVSSLPPVLQYDHGVNLKRLGVDQGLNMDLTTGMIEDRFGNKWVSYLGMGLSKFDGQSFWHFTEKEGLPTGLLWGVWEARDGKLWLNALNEGVIVFDGRSFINYSAKEGFPGNGVRDIFEDSKGNIWVMRRYGVSKYDGETFTHFTTKEGLVDNSIIRIYEDKEGFIWMVGFGKVSRYDGTPLQILPSGIRKAKATLIHYLKIMPAICGSLRKMNCLDTMALPLFGFPQNFGNSGCTGRKIPPVAIFGYLTTVITCINLTGKISGNTAFWMKPKVPLLKG